MLHDQQQTATLLVCLDYSLFSEILAVEISRSPETVVLPVSLHTSQVVVAMEDLRPILIANGAYILEAWKEYDKFFTDMIIKSPLKQNTLSTQADLLGILS